MLTIDTEVFRPIIEQAIAATLERVGTTDRIGYSDSEAGELFGVESHVIRDARRRGEFKSSKVGKEWRTSRETLLKWFQSREVGNT